MADDTTPAETTAIFAEMNETMRQVQESMAAMAGAMTKNVSLSETERAERQKLIDQTKADDSIKRTNDLLKEYGVTLEKVIKGDETRTDAVKRQVNEEQVARNQLLKTLEEEGVIRKGATEAEKEELLNTLELNRLELKRKKIYEDQIKQLGFMFDQNGKIIKQTKILTDEQEKEIAALKKKKEGEDKLKRATEELEDSLSNLGKDIFKLGLTAAFDFLKASIVGTYKAQVAYEDALLEGQTGYTVQAAAISAKMEEMAGAMDNLGSGFVSMGGQLAATGLNVAMLGGPIGLLAIAIGALLAVFGYAAKIEAENMKRTAELKKKQAALLDELFKDFGALGDASMASSRGMTGLKDDLAKVGLTIKEFEKLNTVLKANAKEMSMLGAGTIGGMKNFLDVSAGLIKSELGKTFREMGIDREDMMEHTAKYMAQEQRFGLMQKKSIEDQAKAAGAYVVELDKMATLTGATRKEQETAREAVMQIQSLRAAMMKAKASGNTEEAERLKRYLDVATAFQAQGLNEQAKGTAELAAGKGPISEASAMMIQAAPQMIEMLDKNIGTAVERYATGIKEIYARAVEYADTAAVGGDLSKLVGDYGKIDDSNTKLDQLIELQKKNPDKTLDQLLVAMRKPEDPATKARVEQEEANRTAAIETQERLLNGQELASQQMTNASNTFMDGVIKFMKAVLEFAKHPIDSVKEFFTGKDKSQRDSENLKEKEQELKDTEERIRSLKESTANPEKAKKIADANLKLAEEEHKLKEAALNEMKKKMAQGLAQIAARPAGANKDKTEEEKKLEAKEREKLAIQSAALYKEEQAAREKLNLAKKAVDDNDTGLFSKSADAKKQELAALEKRKANLAAEKAALEQQVKSNPPSETQAAFDKTYGKQTENDIASARSKRQGAPEAPKKELGGIVPGTIDGTTVTVGEKGKPEAIMPLDDLGKMLNTKDSSTKSKATDPTSAMKDLLKMVDVNENLTGIGFRQLDAASKDLEQTKEGNKLTDLNNKLIENHTSIIDDKLIKSINVETETNGKLIISMNKVTEMLPTSIQKIIEAFSSSSGGGSASGASAPSGGGSASAPAGGGSASGASAPSGGGGASPASGGGASPAGGSSGKPGESAMSKSGAAGEVQTGYSVNTGKEIHTGGTISWRTNNPGNVSYGGLAKQYGAIGTWKNPDGDQQQRTTGIAIMPSLEDGDKLKMGLWKRPMYIDKTIDQGVAQWTGTTGLGSAYARDLANAAGASMETKIRELSESQLLSMVTKQRQWEGFKPGKVEPIKAFDGGVFSPRPGGVHVNLAEAGLREAAVPLNPGEKIRIEKSEQDNTTPKKDPLSTVMASDIPTNSNQAAEILAALHDLMESKFDTMISALRDGNDITDKLLKYSQV